MKIIKPLAVLSVCLLAAPVPVFAQGWVQEGEDWLYIDASGNPAVNTWIQTASANKDGSISENYYCLDENGHLRTGWHTENGSTYFLDHSGRMKTGWLLQEKDWYYFGTDGRMKTGVLNVQEKGQPAIYVLDENGKLIQKSWKNIDGNTFYLDSSGKAKNGWLNYGNNWYYLISGIRNGKAKGGVCVNIWAPSGTYLEGENVWSEGCWMDENGIWSGDTISLQSAADTPEEGFAGWENCIQLSTLPDQQLLSTDYSVMLSLSEMKEYAPYILKGSFTSVQDPVEIQDARHSIEQHLTFHVDQVLQGDLQMQDIPFVLDLGVKSVQETLYHPMYKQPALNQEYILFAKISNKNGNFFAPYYPYLIRLQNGSCKLDSNLTSSSNAGKIRDFVKGMSEEEVLQILMN